jgi:hypothetical protein
MRAPLVSAITGATEGCWGASTNQKMGTDSAVIHRMGRYQAPVVDAPYSENDRIGTAPTRRSAPRAGELSVETDHPASYGCLGS